MAARSRRRSRLARCHTLGCRGPIMWFRFRGNWRSFEPNPVDGRTHSGAPAYPVEGKTAWQIRALIEDLMVRREISETDATDEAYDMPWHVPHVCLPPQHKKETRP